MASITIAMRHSQGVTLQYVALSMAEKASITTRLAIAAYDQVNGANMAMDVIKARCAKGKF